MGGLEKCCGRGKVYGGRGEGECEKGGGMWEGVRCVGGLKEYGGRGRVCGGKGGGVWEGWRSVVGGVRCVVGASAAHATCNVARGAR